MIILERPPNASISNFLGGFYACNGPLMHTCIYATYAFVSDVRTTNHEYLINFGENLKLPWFYKVVEDR